MFAKKTRQDASLAHAGAAGGLIGVLIVSAVNAASGGTSEEKLRSQAQARTCPRPQPQAQACLPKSVEMASWYYVHDDRQTGRVTWAVLKQLAATGVLGPQDLVFATETSDWVEASTVPGLLPAGRVG